jgi:sporulation protein YqfC
VKSEIFGFPSDVITDTPSIRWVGKNTAWVINHKGLKECDTNSVLINTKLGIVLIQGAELYIKEINAECLRIEGRIASISYV